MHRRVCFSGRNARAVSGTTVFVSSRWEDGVGTYAQSDLLGMRVDKHFESVHVSFCVSVYKVRLCILTTYWVGRALYCGWVRLVE